MNEDWPDLESHIMIGLTLAKKHNKTLECFPIQFQSSKTDLDLGLYVEKLDDVLEGITKITTLETFLPYCIEEEALVPQVKVVPKQMEAFNTKEVMVIHEEGNVLITRDATKTCEGCVLGKMHRFAFSQDGSVRGTRKLQLVHNDVCGPMGTPSMGNNLYFVTFIDDFSRFCWVYSLKAKSDVFAIFQHYVAMVEKETGCRLFVLIKDVNTCQLRGKLDDKAVKCIFVGYSTGSNGYRLYNPATNKIFESCDVIFAETTAQPMVAFNHNRMDGYKEEGFSSQDRQSIPIVHEVGEGSSQTEEVFHMQLVTDVTLFKQLMENSKFMEFLQSPLLAQQVQEQCLGVHEVGESSRPPQLDDDIFKTQLVAAVTMFSQLMQNPRFLAFLQPPLSTQQVGSQAQRPEPVGAQAHVMHNADSVETPVRLVESMETPRPIPVVHE
ncbi:hypothetical protein L7F22_058699 [Adiantum nelumboides]|nr:hypothetical protein [Adiantum nelumboides]